jgi:23S rRNA (adenine2030-N6)-methyltransferase
MLSYRHAFHAGNHADVLKHTLQIALLDHLNHKEKPWCYIDTHAGPGWTRLSASPAGETAEYVSGVLRVWQAQGSDLPDLLARYTALLSACNRPGKLLVYPGSVGFALQLMRAGDRLACMELHGADVRQCRQNVRRYCPAQDPASVSIEQADGFSAMKRWLPPRERRALVLIDPPYERKEDYVRVIHALNEGLQRFPKGMFALWHPLLQRRSAYVLVERLHKMEQPWLHAQLVVRRPDKAGFGLFGSGMFIINPPWTLEESLQQTMPALSSLLAQGEGAKLSIESHAP